MEIENGQQNILSSVLTLSERMQEELVQCLMFVTASGADADEVSRGFLAKKEITNGTSFCKRESKKLLEDFKEYCIREIETSSTNINDTRLILERKPLFSKTFVEEDVADGDIPETIRKKLGNVERIHHYKDVFNSKGRDFLEDKYSGMVMLAKNRDKLFYAGAPFCQSFGNEHFYYTSCVKNCIYDCSYCYLRGMYPCGIITVFVNLDDYFRELDEILREHSVYLCVSYDTDLLALEPLLGYCRKWIEYAGKHPNLKIEIRTKSGNADAVRKLSDVSTDNVIFAWTLSPDEIVKAAETNVPSLGERLEAAKAAKESGYPVRLCFDPMIFHAGWKESYRKLFSHVFEELMPEDISDISVGVFRISNNYLRRMRNISTDMITAFPYVTEEGACHYGALSDEMQQFAVKELAKYYPSDRIFSWE